MKMKNISHRYGINRPKIDLGLNMAANIVKIKCVSVWWCLYELTSTWATFEAQFMKKLSNAEADLKKIFLYEKSVWDISMLGYEISENDFRSRCFHGRNILQHLKTI